MVCVVTIVRFGPTSQKRCLSEKIVSSENNTITIGLDARSIHADNRRGTGKNLIDLYQQILTLKPNWNVIGYHRNNDTSGIDHPNYTPKHIEMPGDRIQAWFKYRLPYAGMRDHIDLMHYPANHCPNWQPTNAMVTIHDLLPLDGPPAVSKSFQQTIRTVINKQLHVITPSQFTANQLQQRFQINADQITINPWAADQGIKPVTSDAIKRSIYNRYQVNGEYFLHFGAPDLRKNTKRVIEAYSFLPFTIRRKIKLLIVGVDCDQFRQHLNDMAQDMGLNQNEIHIHGFADESDMSGLYSFAKALIYPSLTEGFGLPIVDAFACNLPILTSQTTSLPEVGGNAAIYVNPTNIIDITDGMTRLADDNALVKRLITRGLERNAMYTWQATAKRFIKAVEAQFNKAQKRYAA